MTTEPTPAPTAEAVPRPRLLRRLLIGLGLLALAVLSDGHAHGLLRTVLLYEHWGELREGLTAAKFLASGLGTVLIVLTVGALDRRGRRRAAVLVVVVLAVSASAGLLKVVTGRERPSNLDPLGDERFSFSGPARGLREAPYQSFPSGHVATAFATATCLASFYPAARIVLYGVATAAGINRVVKHQHFLSDVVAGALLGHLLALLLLQVLRSRGSAAGR